MDELDAGHEELLRVRTLWKWVEDFYNSCEDEIANPVLNDGVKKNTAEIEALKKEMEAMKIKINGYHEDRYGGDEV